MTDIRKDAPCKPSCTCIDCKCGPDCNCGE